MSLVARAVLALLCFFLWENSAHSRELTILVLGQSLSSNCNEHRYEESPQVFQISLRGEKVPAKDPMEWAGCNGGSIWVPLGQKLLKSRVTDSVVFMPIGVAATRVSDWQPGGRAYPKLQAALNLAKRRGMAFDYAFWWQGTSDSGINPREYHYRLRSVLKQTSIEIPVGKWLIAEHSGCPPGADLRIAAVQRAVGADFRLERYPGPNVNSVGPEFRFDGCHLNQAGQDLVADAWLKAVQMAEERSIPFQKETLIYYFKQFAPRHVSP